jgi:hypothetical protein
VRQPGYECHSTIRQYACVRQALVPTASLAVSRKRGAIHGRNIVPSDYLHEKVMMAQGICCTKQAACDAPSRGTAMLEPISETQLS